jgi:hypothetical protein
MNLNDDSDFSGNEDEDFLQYSLSPNKKPESSSKKVAELQKIITQ